MNDFLKSLGITESGHYSSKGNYIIDTDEKTFARYYSTLDKSDEVEASEDESIVTQYSSSFVFTSDKYQLTLLSDFDTDKYQLVVREIK